MESIGFPDTEINDIPVLNNSWPKIVEGKYVLIAPHTSRWEEKKRNWGYEKFVQLKDLIENQLKIKCIILENEYSFSEMISLIRHCEFIIGNDSGPTVIAQSFNKKSFIIFGATHPKYLHLSNDVVLLHDDVRHALCNHKTRDEEIGCCEDFCMDRIRVAGVFDTIKANI